MLSLPGAGRWLERGFSGTPGMHSFWYNTRLRQHSNHKHTRSEHVFAVIGQCKPGGCGVVRPEAASSSARGDSGGMVLSACPAGHFRTVLRWSETLGKCHLLRGRGGCGVHAWRPQRAAWVTGAYMHALCARIVAAAPGVIWHGHGRVGASAAAAVSFLVRHALRRYLC